MQHFGEIGFRLTFAQFWGPIWEPFGSLGGSFGLPGGALGSSWRGWDLGWDLGGYPGEAWEVIPLPVGGKVWSWAPLNHLDTGMLRVFCQRNPVNWSSVSTNPS